MSNYLREPDLIPHLMACAEYLKAARHRCVLFCAFPTLVMEGKSFARQIQKEFFQVALRNDVQSLLWLGESPWTMPKSVSVETRSLNQYPSILGQEWDWVVLDARHALVAGALGAAAGVVKAGGFLIILVPELSAWPDIACSEQERLFGQLLNRKSRFIERLVTRIDNSKHIGVIETNRTRWPHFQIPESPSQTLFEQQKKAIEKIVKVVKGHPKRPLVITADRGRGKSAALGMAAAKLINQEKKVIFITAPNREAASVASSWFEKEAYQELAEYFKFVAPDELLRRLKSDEEVPDAVFVDEAAAIPVTVLSQIIQHHNRVVFSTTVQGYEGTGRGFEIRFKSMLEQRFPQWKSFHLNQPIRWDPDDPLESWTNDALLLNTERNDRDKLSADALNWWCYLPGESIEEIVLQQASGLLVESHYQTTPDDLRQWQDHPQGFRFVVNRTQSIAALAMVVEEGPVEPDLLEPISRGERRLRGQMVPQSLAYYLATPDLAMLKGWRVQRIAVQPELRRQQLGSQLLRFIEQLARDRGIDYLSVSFAATEDLTPFWIKAGFVPIRLGLSEDHSSGCHSLMMIKTLHQNPLWESVYHQFFHTTRYWLPGPFQSISTELIVQLWQTDNTLIKELEPHWRKQCEHFCHSHRHLEDSVTAIDKLILVGLANRVDYRIIGPLVSRAWQMLEISAWCEQWGYSGKKEADKALRDLVWQVLSCLENKR